MALFATLIAGIALAGVEAGDNQLELQKEEYEDPFVAARDTLLETIFDPKKIGLTSGFGSVVFDVQYLGDDFGLPVYALSFQWNPDLVCAQREGACEHNWRAVLHRAPPPPDRAIDDEFFRPRWRGGHIVGELVELMASDPGQDPISLVEDLEIERLVATSEGCVSVSDHVRSLSERRWISSEADFELKPGDNDTVPVYLHADRLSVTLRHTLGSTSVRDMVPEQDNVAGWALEFMAMLERCWEPLEQ